jgi:hypothetical protein
MKRKLFWIVLGGSLISGCGGTQTDLAPTSAAPIDREDVQKTNFGKLTDADGAISLPFFGDGRPKNDEQLTVNAALWQASIETLKFMPLASVDSKGGVLITEWYASEENPNEQVKVIIHIKSPKISTDALEVVIHKKIKKGAHWVAASAGSTQARQLEDAILTRAREIKIHKRDNKQ